LKERVLAIVNLIARFIMDDEERALNEQELVQQLLTVGFAPDEIDAAFCWMETVSWDTPDTPLDPPGGIRVLTSEEREAISAEGQGFLFRLRQLGILDAETFEEVLERLVLQEDDPADLAEVKTLTALVLLARSQDRWHREIDHFLDHHDLSSIFH